MNIEVTIPDGKSGDWEIRSFEISEKDSKFFNLQQLFAGHGSRAVLPGKYKKLMRNGTIIMSNTPAEVDDHWELFKEVRNRGGDILINGLGLGVALVEILKNENVTSVTVIELSKDVIKLVGSHFKKDKRVKIINADALEWKAPKGKRYTCVWHDIWDTITSDNTPTMGKLHRKYARRCDWQSSWARWWVKKLKREEYQSSWRW